MQIKLTIKKIFLSIALVCTFTNVYAVGMGVTLGSGSESWDSDTDELNNTYTFQRHSGDRKINNFGFVMDTTVARDMLFNYRFSLVNEENKADVSGYNIDMKGISMIHDFGFGVVRNRFVRFWIGPELKAAFYNDISPSFSTTQTFDGNVWGFGVGPAVGVNIHMPRVVSFSITGAYYVFSQYFGSYDVTNSNGTFFDTVDVDDSSTGLFINASILFRFHDTY